jgi:hypothetical protein
MNLPQGVDNRRDGVRVAHPCPPAAPIN